MGKLLRNKKRTPLRDSMYYGSEEEQEISGKSFCSMKSILSNTVGLKYEEIATTVSSSGLTYITFPLLPIAAYYVFSNLAQSILLWISFHDTHFSIVLVKT